MPLPLFATLPDSPLPPLHLLDEPKGEIEVQSVETLEFTSRLIERKLMDFNLEVKVTAALPGSLAPRLVNVGLLRHLGVAPFGQRARIVAAESKDIAYRQTGFRRLLLKGRGAGQHAARENMLLDEVGTTAITREQLVLDGDALHHGAAFRRSASMQIHPS